MTLERREASIGAGSGRELRGLALPYDVEVRVAGMRERFEPGSASSTGEAVLNVHHREDRPLAREPGTLTFESRADGLYLSATLPETREADDALALVRAEVLTGPFRRVPSRSGAHGGRRSADLKGDCCRCRVGGKAGVQNDDRLKRGARCSHRP